MFHLHLPIYGWLQAILHVCEHFYREHVAADQEISNLLRRKPIEYCLAKAQLQSAPSACLYVRF